MSVESPGAQNGALPGENEPFGLSLAAHHAEWDSLSRKRFRLTAQSHADQARGVAQQDGDGIRGVALEMAN
jgi:hypothetical protein